MYNFLLSYPPNQFRIGVTETFLEAGGFVVEC